MNKKELTALAKKHDAKICSNNRAWGIYHIKEDKMEGFINGVTLAKCDVNYHWSEKHRSFSVMVTLTSKK